MDPRSIQLTSSILLLNSQEVLPKRKNLATCGVWPLVVLRQCRLNRAASVLPFSRQIQVKTGVVSQDHGSEKNVRMAAVILGVGNTYLSVSITV